MKKKDKRRCRFCNGELDQDHFFFCNKLCERWFADDYNLKEHIEREKLTRKLYRAI